MYILLFSDKMKGLDRVLKVKKVSQGAKSAQWSNGCNGWMEGIGNLEVA